MGNLISGLFFIVMIAIIVSVDVLFLKHHFIARLVINVSIVLVFAVIYFVFFRK